jgi:hypothetical protein
MTFDILWTGPDPNTVDMARELIGSTASPEGINAGVLNPVQGMFRHAILPRLATTAAGGADTTKAHYWGIAASQYSSFYLGMWEKPHAEWSPVKNPSTDSWDFENRAGYGIVVVGANWVKMSSGDGTA